MESDRRSVWNQSERKIHATRDAVRLRRLHTRSREITYQSFGLDRKKQVFRLAFFLAPPAGLVQQKAAGGRFLQTVSPQARELEQSYAL